MKLHEMTERLKERRKRVGRGQGSGLGKTCGRGEKGDGSRSGYRRRYGYEGGALPLYKKLPTKGFNHVSFQKKLDIINLKQIDDVFQDGDIVNIETLKEKGFISGPSFGVKILGNGDLTKKVKFEVNAFSKSALEKLEQSKIEYTLI